LRAKQRLKLILPIVFFTIFLLLYMVFHSVTEAVVLIVPTIYAMTGGLLLQWLFGYNFNVAVSAGYIALLGIAVETGVVMVVYLHESLERRLLQQRIHSNADIEQAVIEGAVRRLRPKLMTVLAVLASLVPILWQSGIGSDVMKPIAAPIVGGMITSTIHVLILVPVFFVIMKERALKRGTLIPGSENSTPTPHSSAMQSPVRRSLAKCRLACRTVAKNQDYAFTKYAPRLVGDCCYCRSAS
jgi:copper/silver efflux system protein